MRREDGNNDIVLAIIAIAVSLAVYSLIPRLFLNGIEDTYRLSLYKQITFAVPVFIFVILLRKAKIYIPNRKMFREGWKSSLVFIFILIFNLLLCFNATIDVDGITFLLFVIQMFLIGYCEETLFRGLLLNAFHRFFGQKTMSGARLAVVFSGILFGLMHILNARNPEISFTSAGIQATGAAFLGMFLGAIYIRVGKGLWYLVILHALNDMLAFISSGRMSGTSAGTIIDQLGQRFGVTQILVFAVFYGGLTVFILRKSKLEPCLEKLYRMGRF